MFSNRSVFAKQRYNRQAEQKVKILCFERVGWNYIKILKIKIILHGKDQNAHFNCHCILSGLCNHFRFFADIGPEYALSLALTATHYLDGIQSTT